MSTQKDVEATREKIVEAAMESMRQRGPANISLRDIARRAGVAVSLISHHFDSKDGLLIACLQRMYAQILEGEARYRERLTRGEDSVELLLGEMIEEGYHFARAHRALVRIGLRMVAESGTIPKRWRDLVLEPFLATWSTEIARRSGVAPRVVRIRLHTLTAVCARFALSSDAEMRSVLGDEDATADAITEEIVQHLVDVASRMAS